MISLLILLAAQDPGATTLPSSPLGAYHQSSAGDVHRLGGARSARGTALVFLNTECPIARRYSPRLVELSELAAQQGLGFFGVVSGGDATAAEVETYREEYGLSFPVLLDPACALAARLGPTHVPESFVFDAAGGLIYRGRIDNQFAAIGKPRNQVTSHDLEGALKAASGGDPVANSSAEPVGCLFETEPPTEPTYHEHVAPILMANCLVCHRKGEVGPFALESYSDAKRRARMIAEVCEDQWMPPWQANENDGPFLHARHLHAREIAVLKRWADAGAPEGQPDSAASLPPAPESGWRLGEPDLVLTIPAFTVPASGPDIYQHFVLPTGLTEDAMVTAIDLRPGDPAVVHHAIAYLDDEKSALRRDEDYPGPGYDGFAGNRASELFESLGGWAPGTQPYPPRPGLGRLLRKDRAVVLEVHYHPDGRERVDDTALAIYLAKEPVTRIFDGLIGTDQIEIEPGDDEYWRMVWMELPCDFTLLELSPHMHQVGTEFHVEAIGPDDSRRTLISIDEWDFRWQDNYILANSIELKKGTRIEARARFDNSASNPSNPNSPPQVVRRGWGTGDEMCLFYFSGLVSEEQDRRKMERAMFRSFMRPAELK